MEEVGTRRLTADEEAALDAVRAGYAAHGIDPADLDSIAAAYDRALDAPRRRRDSVERSSSCSAPRSATTWWPPAATAGWSAPTRSAPTWPSSHPRRGVPVVTRMLVAARWMGRERGWVAGVVGHLADVGRS